VTVLTNPSGQQCTVSHGSGTAGSTNITNVGVTCTTTSANSITDNFNRANGSLGSGWTALSDGALSISSQMVIGTKASANSGDIRTAESYASNQYSTIQTTSTQLTGGQWIGAMVRAQGTGTGLYTGIYFWNSGSPELMLFKRINGAWTQLGSTYASGALPAGTSLTLTATGSTLTFAQNGVTRITATDTSLTGGAPGIIAYGTSTADNWSGGNVVGTTTVGGTVSGLSGTVVLQDNGADNLSVSANGSFTFATALSSGQAYNVTVLTNPSGQQCSVSNGSGTAGSSNITNVTVSCTTNAPSPVTVGGTVSGLSGTVVLQDNGADNLSVSANGSFTFATALSSGQAYNVTVLTNPSGQQCAVSNGSGTAGSSNITNVGVTCTANTTNSITDNFARANGSLGPNWTALSDGALSISSQMVIGTNPGANSGDIRTAETYASDQYSTIQTTSTPLTGGQWIGPMVRVQGNGSGLYTGIYYWNSGSPVLMMFARINGSWTQLGSTYASGALPAGTSLTLTATGSTLTFAQNGVTRITATDTSLTGGAPGIIAFDTPTATSWAGGNVNGSLPVATPKVTVGGSVSGVSGTVVLQDNATDNLSVSANGSFTFATALSSGQAYNVTVLTNPTGQQCSVSNGSGNVGSTNITNVGVTCTTNAPSPVTVGGTVSGVSGTVVLQDNGTDNLSVSANGSFTFATALSSGQGYSVTVLTNPTGQQCSVSNASGSVGSTNITNVAVVCTTSTPTATDNFARADGSLGSNWTALPDGALSISSQVVIGTNSGGSSGDVRTAESYTSDQYSTVETTSTQLTGGQWIGPIVRAQSSGDLYAGMYNSNYGTPELMLFKRISGAWTQLGSTYASGALPAGTQLTLTAIGNTLAFSQNGVPVITATDSSLTGGAPGIMAYGTATAGNWAGGSSGFQVDYLSTDSTGIQSYDMLSRNNGYGSQVLRVLQPTHPAAGVAHNFLFVLPVEPGLGNQFGDGLATLQALDAEDTYNLTIVEPSFYNDPWYANNSTDPNLQYETFMTNDLVPWVKANLSTTGKEQNWLIGFSKSGIGGQDLILKHPDVFALAASWDFPAGMTSYDQYGADSAQGYGSQANFASNYELSTAFVSAHEAPFLTANRIWLGGYALYSTDVSSYDALLTSQGIVHTMGPWVNEAHRWDSGWVPAAVAALYQDSLSLPPSS
jgi:hypothetical protein